MIILFLNSVGGFEVMFILLAVLMLFGSKSIPGLAKTLGKGMREMKTASNEIRRDIQNSTSEMRKDLNIQNPLDEMKKLIEQPSEPKDFRPDNPETTLEAPENTKPVENKTTPLSQTEIEPPIV